MADNRDDKLQLMFSGKVLERWHTLSYYNIPGGSVIDVSVVLGWYQIRVKTLTGKMTALEVHGRYSVRALKDQIEEKEGMPADQQQLMIHGSFMNNDDATMNDYAIRNDSVVHLVARYSLKSGQKIPVKILKETIFLDSGPLKMIKSSIKQMEGIHQDEQMLMLADKELKDDEMTVECGPSLHLLVRQSFNARLLFHSSGRTWSIAMQTSDTIAGIKSKILDRREIVYLLPTQARYVLERGAKKTESSHPQREIQESTLLQKEIQELKNALQRKEFAIQSIRAKNEEVRKEIELERQRSFKLQQDVEGMQREHSDLLKDIRAKGEVIMVKEEEIREKAEQIALLQKKVQLIDTGNHIQPSTGSLRSWNIPRAEIRSAAEREIGRGAWGVVYSGTFRGQRVAIKQAHREVLHLTTIEMLKREVLIMADLQHPNLVRFIAAVIDVAVERGTDMPIIVLELMDTNLRAAYKDHNLSTSLISIFRDVAYALHYLHHNRQPIIHRDLSAPNVLLKVLQNGAYQAKLSDFGSANLLKMAQTAGPGAVVYSAPEMFPNEDIAAPPRPQTTKVDVFSYGILLLEVIVKDIPIPENRHTMLQQVSRRWKLMHELIIHCTKPLPSDRPTMADILHKLNKIPLRT